MASSFGYKLAMQEPVIVCGREFSPNLLTHLQQLASQQPAASRNQLARETCLGLAWYSPDGRPALSSAKVALNKLDKRGLLQLPRRQAAPRQTHRLRRSGHCLPPLARVPSSVERVEGLELYLLSGEQDPLHGLWNDLMIEQHPCGDAPLVGAQLRYLIGSQHGWLGALGFGPAAFVLACRDQWIGWSTMARLSNLRQVIGLSRVLIRREVRCGNLVSKVLSLALKRVGDDWQERYGVRPRLVETYVDRSRFNGRSLAAANWRRLGQSTGRGRRGPKGALKSLKDVWVYPLASSARTQLQTQTPRPLRPDPIAQSLAQPDWCAWELRYLELGDRRRQARASAILAARWEQPQASFYGSFKTWGAAKGAYALIEHPSPDISLSGLLASHQEQTQGRMAAESWVLLPQDTTSLNYTGLKQTTGLGSLGDTPGRGLWLHSLLAFRPDGVPLGILQADCWARPLESSDLESSDTAQRNAQSIVEKESVRWVKAFAAAAQAAGRMPQTQLVVITDREGDIYELHDAVHNGPANLHILVRAQFDRNLQGHQKLWGWLAEQPLGERRRLTVPRRGGQPSRTAAVEVRWSQVSIQAPAVGCKKGWPALSLWAIWVREPTPPAGIEPLDWMILTDRPILGAEAAWEKVQWYCRRWGIEEWHRALKNGCGAEQREFETAEHLQRALAFDLIVAWRVLACVKLGRALPQLPATVLYTPQELKVLGAAIKKNSHRSASQS
jgi:uncharacterized protein DUF4338/transposase-like protein